MAKYTALDIAKWFIQRNKIEEEQNDAEQITLLKLLKLLYYAEGCSLALDNGSLFDDDIVAWEHGPVVVDIYKHYCSNPYDLPLEEEESLNKIEKCDIDCLEQVFQVFGAYTAWALRNKTHNEAPWLEATNNGEKLNGVISRTTIQEYFKNNYIVES